MNYYGLYANGFGQVSMVSNTYENGQGKMVFSGTITDIGAMAFYQARKLKSIIIPNGVTKIWDSAFQNCSNLQSVTIGDGVKTIVGMAFGMDSMLTNVTMGNSVTYIGMSAFIGDVALKSIHIPASVKTIGENAFAGCIGLTSICVDDQNTVYDSRGGCNALIETASNTLMRGCINTTIPSSVTKIDAGAFSDITNLTSINLPNGITELGWGAFYGCSGLTTVKIPASVTNIGPSVFCECTGLQEIICEAIVPPYCDTISSNGNYVFMNVDKNIPLRVPAQSVMAYRTADVWKDFRNIVAIGDADAIEENYLINAPKKYLQDGQVLILKDKKVYDMRGRQVK